MNIKQLKEQLDMASGNDDLREILTVVEAWDKGEWKRETGKIEGVASSHPLNVTLVVSN